jgi:hypothetical protein
MGALTVETPLLFCSRLSGWRNTVGAFWRTAYSIGAKPKVI